MRKRFLVLAILLVLTLNLCVPAMAASEGHFTDVPKSHWAFNSIERVYAAGIVKGTTETTFSPEGAVTNAQYMLMLGQAFYPIDVDSFTQTMTNPNVKWWRPAAEVAYGNGTIDGTTVLEQGMDGRWHEDIVNAPINRYDMAQMMYNIMKEQNKVNVTEADKTATHAKMADWSSIPAKYQDAVATCYALGLLAGTDKGTFDGDSSMTRAQAAAVICRMLDAVNGGTAGSTESTESTEPTETENPPVTAGTGYRNSDGTTAAAGVNGVHDRVKRDADKVVAGVTFKGYPTTGHSDTSNKNGYFTEADVDLGNAILVYGLLDMVNEERIKEGLSPLEWVPYDEAEEYTLMRAYELTRSFSHGRAAGGPGIGGEVIGQGQASSQEVFEDWMNSPGHRATLMSDDILYMCAAEATGRWIITVWDENILDVLIRNADNDYYLPT